MRKNVPTQLGLFRRARCTNLSPLFLKMENYQISGMLHISSMPQTMNKAQHDIHVIIFPTEVQKLPRVSAVM
jgi:hypothetical protein